MSNTQDNIVYLAAYVIIPKITTAHEEKEVYTLLTKTFHRKLENDPERLTFIFNKEEKGHRHLIEQLSTQYPKVKTKVLEADFNKNKKNAYILRNKRALKYANCLITFSNGTRNQSEEFATQEAEDGDRFLSVRGFKLTKEDTHE